MLAFALEHADLFGQAVAPGLQLFGAGLDRLAFGFEGAEGLNVEERLGVLAGLQTRDHGVQILAKQGDV